MSFGSGGCGASSSRAHPHTSACFRSRAPGPVSGQLYGADRLEGQSPGSAFLSPFGCRRLLLVRPVPATGFCSPYGRLTTEPTAPWTLTGFPRFTRMRHGRVGCPLYPGGDGVPTAIGASSAVVCRLSAAGLLSPRHDDPTRRVAVTRHLQGFTGIHPSGPSPHLWPLDGAAALGLSLSLAPGHYWPRTSGRGPVSNTDRESRLRHRPNLQSTYSLIACDLVSQRSSAKSGVQRLIAVSGSATLRQLPSAGAVEAEPGQLARVKGARDHQAGPAGFPRRSRPTAPAAAEGRRGRAPRVRSAAPAHGTAAHHPTSQTTSPTATQPAASSAGDRRTGTSRDVPRKPISQQAATGRTGG